MSKKAEELCSGVHVLHDESLELAEAVLFMAKKLKESRALMKNEPIVIEYDNGGGQSGIRENPKFKAYESLWKSYISGAKLIVDALPQADVETVADTSAKPQTVLSMIQSKRSEAG